MLHKSINGDWGIATSLEGGNIRISVSDAEAGIVEYIFFSGVSLLIFDGL